MLLRGNRPKLWKWVKNLLFTHFARRDPFVTFPRRYPKNQSDIWNLHDILDQGNIHQSGALTSSSGSKFSLKDPRNYPRNNVSRVLIFWKITWGFLLVHTLFVSPSWICGEYSNFYNSFRSLEVKSYEKMSKMLEKRITCSNMTSVKKNFNVIVLIFAYYMNNLLQVWSPSFMVNF